VLSCEILFIYFCKLAEKGKINSNFQRINDIEKRENYNKRTGKGMDAIFNLRSNFSDFTLINTFVDQDFVDKYNLFVVGKRLDESRGVIQYYVKSKKAADYKKMLIDSLYHPPIIDIDMDKTGDTLSLVHKFEGKQLIKDFIFDTLMGIEYLWGNSVTLKTTEIVQKKNNMEYRKVLYTMKDRKITKNEIEG